MAGESGLTMSGLHVAHWPSAADATAEPLPPAAGLAVTTCLRRVWVSAAPVDTASDAEHYAGAAAYRFLLEFITGLHSAIPGETNVLGQFRQAWSRWRLAAPVAAGHLAGTIDHLLRDAKRIRARHLQGVGGDSYGSLVRRLIKPTRGDKVLVVGAGELARSIWPFFRQQSVACWNRSAIGEPVPDWLGRFAPPGGAKAAAWAQHVILATPADTFNDSRWAQWLEAGAPRTVTHLGHRERSRLPFSGTASLYCLDQLFELRQARANVRSLRIARARAACRHLAARLDPQVDTPLQFARA